MKSLKQALRLSVGLLGLAVGVVCLLHSRGALPDSTAATLRGRKELCEAVSIFCSSAAVRDDRALLETTARAIVERNRGIRSFTVVRDDGTVLAQAGEPSAGTPSARASRSSPDHAHVPIFLDGRRWGTVEVRFQPLIPRTTSGLPSEPAFRFMVLLAAGVFLSDVAYLWVVFHRQGARSDGVPQRVRATLDTLVEGVLLMDTERRIALVNESFARTVGWAADEIEGRTAEELDWKAGRGDAPAPELPWEPVLQRGTPELGRIIGLKTHANGSRTLSVNATPIVTDDGACHGVLATFDDMSTIERKNFQLRKLTDRLKKSRAEIHSQNQKLKDLADLDPLTSCFNRRAFFERFDAAWEQAGRHGRPLSCLMLDIDHFKSVNDRHGHAVGDEALRVVSGVLRSMVRPGDLVCRYGGEEFCVLFPETTDDEAAEIAERFRATIAGSTFAGISVTSSFGVAAVSMGASDPHDLINRADQALYAAKHTGRNRVVRFDQKPEVPAKTVAPAPTAPRPATAEWSETALPFHAVTSLVSALAHRDTATAEHSRRVADLCAETARGLLSERDGYLLEVAALLHDVGKLGIPDAILRKPGGLTEEEWSVMRAHDRMGVEILAAAFSSEPLRKLIACHHAWFGGNPSSPELPSGDAIPVGARILAIADAYDAMVSDRVYRKALGHDQAFAELRRCSGEQFDPALVDRFIAVVQARDEGRGGAALPVSNGAALRIGLLIESLADALDSNDSPALDALATRLGATASELQLTAMADLCGRLRQSLTSGSNRVAVMELTGELLDLCRSIQRDHLATVVAVTATG